MQFTSTIRRRKVLPTTEKKPFHGGHAARIAAPSAFLAALHEEEAIPLSSSRFNDS